MLYGERHVKLEHLKAWSSSLHMSQAKCDPNDPLYRVLGLQLKLFQSVISSLAPGDDWRDALRAVSPLFQETFFKTEKNAVYLANYYECFVVPANIETKKKIIQGYATSEKIGEVELYDGRVKIGSIGQKSDLIWSVFYPYFVVESNLGSIEHTLPNHEEFLTLQLWNVEGKCESEIVERINNILFKLAIEKGLNLKRAQPAELWKNRGAPGIYGIQVSDKKLEAIPLAYMNYAITCENPRMAFLHFYQVLEYFFVRAQNQKLMEDLLDGGVMTAEPIDDARLRQTLKLYINSTREIESLKLVLQKIINIQDLKDYINRTEEKLHQYTTDTTISDKIQIRLDAADAKIISKLAERIYFFRCSIAHAKGDIGEYLTLPAIGDSTINDELPLLESIAYQALQVWGKNIGDE